MAREAAKVWEEDFRDWARATRVVVRRSCSWVEDSRIWVVVVGCWVVVEVLGSVREEKREVVDALVGWEWLAVVRSGAGPRDRRPDWRRFEMSAAEDMALFGEEWVLS